ncbi:hypothetical protein RvY_14748 [Ramazzottius varieornatus]|uniref:RWD domain-containing protein n=1 Tax=Ramazzottius varieornatus TaxID=947166 RepID=A0A1D1VXE2_RAMVA|nr:hypothetical protein RvY_14748 [Ramazzottius varieornatus]
MDHKEEQQMEVETLLSIYPDEMTMLTAENSDPDFGDAGVAADDTRTQFTLQISSSEAAFSSTGADRLATEWKFVFPPTYPEVPLEAEMLDPGEVPANIASKLEKVALSTARENVGMAAVFTVVSAVQDELNRHSEECLNRIKEMEERAKREEEESDRKKMEGTRVTVESFIAWKAKFDAERLKKANKPVLADVTQKRLTGRQMFEQNKMLDDSDAILMEEGEEAVDIDDREGLDEDFDHELFEQELLNEEGGGDSD